MDLEAVDAVLAGQFECVRERVERTHQDFDQLDEITKMRAIMPAVDAAIGSPRFLGSLANPDSKRATLLVELADGSRGVLKVAGSFESGEAAVLEAWTRAGIAAARPLAWGDAEGASYLLTDFREGISVKTLLARRMMADAREVVAGGRPIEEDALRRTMREVFETLTAAHISPDGVEGIRHVTERVEAPLYWSLRHLVDSGREKPAHLDAALERMQSAPAALLHGDPWVDNMLYDNGVVLIDPAACYGPPEYDVAQAIAQVTPPGRFGEMFRLAMSIDRSLDEGLLRSCAGVYLTIEAGLNAQGATNRADSARGGHAPAARAAETYEAAARLLREGMELSRSPALVVLPRKGGGALERRDQSLAG